MGAWELLKAYYEGRSVLVTGATGFKGSWLCCLLRALGARVTGYALAPPTSPSLWDLAGVNQYVNAVTADVRDLSSLRVAFDEAQPSAVFHLAAQPLVIDSYHRPRYTYETNVMGTVNVLECVRACDGVRSFLNVTTDKVYLNRELDGYAYKESDQLDGWDPYSNSKSCSELVTHSYARSFFSDESRRSGAKACAISTARAGNVIGGGDFASNRIVPDCVRAATSGTPLVLRNPNSVRPYQHVLEPLSAYLLTVALQGQDASKQGWYNIGPESCDCVTTGEIVRIFADAWGPDFRYEIGDVDGPHEANFLMLSNEKAKSELGWKPTWNVVQAVCKTVEWTKAWQASNQNSIKLIMDSQIREFFERMC